MEVGFPEEQNPQRRSMREGGRDPFQGTGIAEFGLCQTEEQARYGVYPQFNHRKRGAAGMNFPVCT